MEELWYHVDVNSAFLSWSAAHEIWIKGGDLDLRTVPSVIGGNEKDRHGGPVWHQDRGDPGGSQEQVPGAYHSAAGV